MIPSIGVPASAVLVFAAVSLFTALTVAVLYPAARRAMHGLPPSTHAGLLLALACAPAVAGLAFLTFALWPSLAHLLGWAIDHCHAHGHHAHFCLVHAPWWTDGILEGLVLIGAGLAAVWPLTSVALGVGRVRAVERALRMAEVARPAPRFCRFVDSRLPLAVTVGLIRPRIYLSSRLLEVLSPAELRVIVGHEQAHRRRRDTLSRLVADLLSRLHVPWVRRRLLADLSLATERACDEEAARSCGDRLGVAEAILKIVRVGGGRATHPDPLLATVTGADVQARVDALLQPAPVRKTWPRSLVAGSGGLLATAGWVYAEPLHHAVESALHLFSQ